MTDLDGRLRSAGEAFRAQPVPDLDLHWPEQKPSQRWLAPLAVAAAVALVVGGVVAVKSLHHDAATPPAKPAPAQMLKPDRKWVVAAPPEVYIHGGAPYLGAVPPTCDPRALTVSAITRPADDGVMGVVALKASADCSVRSKLNQIRLLDAAGKALRVPLGEGNGTSTFSSANRWTGRLNGALHIGFAWTGSYCGPAPAAIEIKVNGTWLRAPFLGPVPACDKRTNSQLVLGDVGAPSQAVIPQPVAWNALSAQLVLPRTVKGDRAIELNVVLTNHGKAPVSLTAPCPAWSARETATVAGNGTSSGSDGDLCSEPITVLPGHPLHVFAGRLTYNRRLPAGADVTVTWGISGVPAATAKSVVG